MRWDALFADLEGQAEAAARAERAADVEERTRGEVAGLTVVDRARAAIDEPVRLSLAGGFVLAGVLGRIGPDWLLVDEGEGREALVALGFLLRLRGLGRYSAVPGSADVVSSRLGLCSALRGMARDRGAVQVLLRDGSTLDATVDRVGADFVEVATHPAGEWRRSRAVRDVELVPLGALVAVRRGG